MRRDAAGCGGAEGCGGAASERRGLQGARARCADAGRGGRAGRASYLGEALGGFGEHRLDRHAGGEARVVGQVVDAVREQRANDDLVVRHLRVDLLDDCLGRHEALLQGVAAQRGHRLAPRRRREAEGVRERDKRRLLGEADPHLALQRAHDVLRLLLLRGHQHRLDLVLLALHRLVAARLRNLLEALVHAAHRERLRLAQRHLLRARGHRHLAQVAHLLHIVLDRLDRAAARLRDGLDHDRVADAQLDALVRGRELVGRDRHERQQVVGRRRDHRAEGVGHQLRDEQPLGLRLDAAKDAREEEVRHGLARLPSRAPLHVVLVVRDLRRRRADGGLGALLGNLLG